MLRIPLFALLIAVTGACGSLIMSTAQAEIRTGLNSILLTPDIGRGEILSTSWDLVKANYYSPSYPDFGGFVPDGSTFVTVSTVVASAALIESFSTTLAVYNARIPSNDSSSTLLSVQFFTAALDLGALVGPNESFFAADIRLSNSHGQVWRFGYSVTMPEAPSPLYGWFELDGSDSTFDSFVVNATWAYDTTGAPITVGTVPEPTTLTLIGLGCLALLARYRLGRKQS